MSTQGALQTWKKTEPRTGPEGAPIVSGAAAARECETYQRDSRTRREPHHGNRQVSLTEWPVVSSKG